MFSSMSHRNTITNRLLHHSYGQQLFAHISPTQNKTYSIILNVCLEKAQITLIHEQQHINKTRQIYTNQQHEHFWWFYSGEVVKQRGKYIFSTKHEYQTNIQIQTSEFSPKENNERARSTPHKSYVYFVEHFSSKFTTKAR